MGASSSFFLGFKAFGFSAAAYGYGLFAVVLVRNGKFLTTFGAAGGQNAATVFCSHSLAEAVLVHSSPVVRLESSFHCSSYFLLLLFTLWAAKVLIFFLTAKETGHF